jgi:hypothetical protein
MVTEDCLAESSTLQADQLQTYRHCQEYFADWEEFHYWFYDGLAMIHLET